VLFSFNRIHIQSRAVRATMPFCFVAALALFAAPATTFAQTPAATTVTPTFNCTLTVPANPLTVTGLMTAYTLAPTNNGITTDTCDETDPNAESAVFVQAAIYDLGKTLCGQVICLYNPVVVNAGTSPSGSITNPAPNGLPADAVVALWFGGDGGTVTLAGPGATSGAPNYCSTGASMGQFAYCNAKAFFAAVNPKIADGTIVVPQLGVSPKDHQACPSVRSFSIVDQDQSDNQTTWYLIVPGSPATIAQFNPLNVTAYGDNGMGSSASILQNPSDEWLDANFVAGALGCTPFLEGVTALNGSNQKVGTPWEFPDLTQPMTVSAASSSATPSYTPVVTTYVYIPSLVANELQAAKWQTGPIALIPLGDPFAQADGLGNTNLQNVNNYRDGVDQTEAATVLQASTATYCTNLRNVGPTKLLADQTYLKAVASPLPVGDSLFTTLAGRMMASYVNLNCQSLINQPNPITVTSPANWAPPQIITGVSIKVSSTTVH